MPKQAVGKVSGRATASDPIEMVKIKKVNISTKNSYRVPKKTWDKWSERSRVLFNSVFSAMTGNQEFFKHPKQKAVPADYWKTTAWNAAWTAASESEVYVPQEN